MSDIRDIVRRSLADEAARLSDRLERIGLAEVALCGFSRGGEADLVFRIRIDSHWDGETDLDETYPGPLADALDRAEASYMATNRRSDVQGTVTASVVLAHVGAVPLPRDVFEPLLGRSRSPSP